MSEKEAKEVQIERLELADIHLVDKELTDYIKGKDDLGEYNVEVGTPIGYKKCGKCNHVLKLYLFNKNSGSKTCTSGNCKVCQKKSAAKSYSKTKRKRNYKKYYAAHKSEKQEQARKYYEENKEKITARHKEYLQTKRGKKVMQKAHAKRHKAMEAHKGIPYERLWVIDRDMQDEEYPICYLCGKPILDCSGKGLHLDHVVSINNGGLDCFTNVACVHSECNLRKEKDDRNLDAKSVEDIIKLAEDYIDDHPELFEED